ncbi:putative cell division cycle [Phaeomoniella chlamydospora]|uniref:Putative cell division cycle n=1 Tax=Phaeomoniella chlamydospora TaxID=158046 RepID=A0A0G2DYH1_PHACM|nr:putative cell division cycle [Phaeomoniella chlamydospora]
MNHNPREAALEMKEASKYLLAKSYFDTREYDRCAAVFLPPGIPAGGLAVYEKSKSRTPLSTPQKTKGKSRNPTRPSPADPFPKLSQKSLFLALYARYMSGEKRKDEESEMVLGPADGGVTVNRELADLARGLEGYFHDLREEGREEQSDGWLEYLYESALLHYHAKDFETASEIFNDLLVTDPHRLDALDHYSNILYVMGNRPQLSFLAQLATATDKFRPETCCVVGNYYSLKSEHEKAVMYFRRALTLDRNFLSAWTLMGHEYIEMKNTHAAIESYRRAVDVNRKDYRAWYGLGQAYEVLDMSFYALFYYQRAAALRPYDPKMWQAVGSCYSKMGRHEPAIKSLKRALIAGAYYENENTESNATSFDSSVNSLKGRQSTARDIPSQSKGRKLLDPETLYQIAQLYEKLGDMDTTAEYMEVTVAQENGSTGKLVAKGRDLSPGDDDATEAFSDEDADGDAPVPGEEPFGTGVTATTSKARLWLARWAMRTGELDRAETLCEELCQDGVEVEEAKAGLREIRALREAGGPASQE